MASPALVSPEKSTTVRTRKPTPFALRAARSGMGVLSLLAPEIAAVIGERMFLTPRRHPRPAAEHELLDRARLLRVPTTDGALAVWEWGDEGPRVLLVHGWEGRGAQLGAMVEPLVTLGHRVVTFDGPGHGSSTGERSSLFDIADAVVRVAESFGPFHAVVTHSMGGPAAIVASQQKRIADRLVMIAPPADLRDFSRGFARMVGMSDDARTRLDRRLGERFGVPIEEIRAERLAPTMHARLLVIHDEDDREVPIACGESIARAWPGAELVRTRGLGHRRVVADARVVRSVVRFIARPEGAIVS